MVSSRLQVRVIRKFKEGWLCAEAVTLSILDQLKMEAEPQLIRAVSAFNRGMGGTGSEHCGAFTGGVPTLGVLLGRDVQGDDLSRIYTEVAAFKQWFIDQHGSLNCRELVDSFNGLRESECVSLAASTAEYLESRLNNLSMSNTISSTKRGCVSPGQCPFGYGE